MKNLLARAFFYLILRRGGTVFLLATCLTVASIGVSLRIDVKTNFKDTLDEEKDRSVRNATEIKKQFPSASTVYVTVEGVDRARMVAAALDLKDRLSKDEHVAAVYLKLNLDFFKDYGLVYLRREDLARILRTVRSFRGSFETLAGKPGLPTLLSEIEAAMDRGYSSGDSTLLLQQRISGARIRSGGLEVETEIDRDKLREEYEKTLLPLLLNMPLPPSEEQFRQWIAPIVRAGELAARIVQEGADLSTELPRLFREFESVQFAALGKMPSEYRISEDGTMLLLEVSGVGDIHELIQAEPFVASIHKILDDVGAEHPDVQIGTTGFPVIYVEENRAVLNNFGLVLALSAVGVLTVFIIGFGQAGLPAISFIPLIYGLAYTFGVQALVIGELNMISLMFPVLLMGTGIDYGIHVISAFTEQRRTGLPGPQAMEKAIRMIGPGILTGSVTTAAAFLSLVLADFKGVQHFGFISAVGILTALASMCLVLPPLVLWVDRREVKSGHPIQSFEFDWLGSVARFSLRFRYFLLAAFFGGTIYFAGKLPDLTLDRNVTNLQPRGLAAADLQTRILEKFDLSTEVAAFIADDLDQARQIQKALEARKTVGQVWSITSLIPEERRQDENRQWIRDIQAELEKVAATLEARRGEGAFTLESDPQKLEAVLEDRILRHEEEAAQLRAEGQEVADRMGGMKTSLARIKLALLDLSVIARIFYKAECEELVGRLRDSVNAIDSALESAQTPDAKSRMGIEYLDYALERKLLEAFDQLVEMSTHSALHPQDLPADILKRFQDHTGSRYVVFAYPGRDPWERRFLERHLEDLSSVRVRAPKGDGAPAADLARLDPDDPALTEADMVEVDENYVYRAPKFSGVIPVWMTMIDKITRDLPATLLSTFALICILLLPGLARRGTLIALFSQLALVLGWALLQYFAVLKLPHGILDPTDASFEVFQDIRIGFLNRALAFVANPADVGVLRADRIALLGLLLTFLNLLVYDRRALAGTLIQLMPLVVGLVWTLGFWALLGLQINVVSIIALPLILGLGIDYGVYIFNRIVQEGETRIDYAVMETGKAVLLSALTTIIGFGSLLASVHQGFFHLGLLVSVGITMCYVASVVFLPALMEFLWFSGERVQASKKAEREKSAAVAAAAE